MFIITTGLSPQDAAKKCLHFMAEKVERGNGGVVALNKDGDIGIYMTSEGMSWAYLTSDEKNTIHYGVFKNDHNTVSLT